jgi:hypothetical protein
MKIEPTESSVTGDGLDLRAYNNPSELHGTCYFELMPSRYRNKCWNHGSLFIPMDAFLLVEWAFARHIAGYDHYSFMHCDVTIMQRIAKDLAEYSRMIQGGVTPCEIITFCRLPHNGVEADIARAIRLQKDELVRMIEDVRQWITEKALQTPEFSILGM